MDQKSNVAHWPDKPLETAELQPLIREGIIQPRALARLQTVFLLLLTISRFFRRLDDGNVVK